jgi:Helix-turn-helix domain
MHQDSDIMTVPEVAEALQIAPSTVIYRTRWSRTLPGRKDPVSGQWLFKRADVEALRRRVQAARS